MASASTIQRTVLSQLSSQSVYRTGANAEWVVIIHDGDASGDLLFDTSSGSLGAGAAIAPRNQPILLNIDKDTDIFAMSTAGSRGCTIIGTPVPEGNVMAIMGVMLAELTAMREILTFMAGSGVPLKAQCESLVLPKGLSMRGR